jgi:hypothetical protein
VSEVIHLETRRKPVTYTLHVSHYWDGKVELIIDDLDADIREDHSVMQALGVLVDNHRARDLIEYLRDNMPPDMT